MKKMKKIMALVLAMVMVLAMNVSVFAQDKTKNPADADNATITISNASKGVTYSVYKLFDATVTGTADGSIAYQGTIPSSLADYFEVINGADGSSNYVKLKTGVSEENLFAALKTWAAGETALISEVSDGSVLNFKGLPYGYYVVTSTQGTGAAITVTSTNPNASIHDKNTTIPVNDLKKTVNSGDKVVSIGDTITYTITFKTANYDGTDQIIKYTIADTLPDFMADVTVTSIIVDNDANTATTDDQVNITAQFSNKKIELTWAENGTSKYNNGALVTVIYTARVTDKIVAGNVESNANTVTVTPATSKGDIESKKDDSSETIKTFAAALQKTDESGNDLAGATFQVPGLTVTGSNGNYTVVSYDPTSQTTGTVMSTDDTGFLAIRGISDELPVNIIEVNAPDGYNKLTDPARLNVVQTSTTTTITTKYYENGVEVDSKTETTTTEISTNDDLVNGATRVVNRTGATLPSTGGMGTTIFYVLGAILVLGAGVVLVSRRRMEK